VIKNQFKQIKQNCTLQNLYLLFSVGHKSRITVALETGEICLGELFNPLSANVVYTQLGLCPC